MSKTNNEHGFRKLPLSHNSADSQASALRLVLTLFPDWEKADGQIEFIRFKEGITNTEKVSLTRYFANAVLLLSFWLDSKMV
ncbi:MAG: hypothetical protein L6R35_002723 [Caloplaca aegaea]|nr:MAG: hypothetical protein L6R35_002723 [Caloplaca aegaea]